MKSLLLRISKKIRRTGMIEGADVVRLLDYNSRHPMWQVTADDLVVKTYDAIIANYRNGAGI